jgi:hypothetical protein
LMVILLKSVSGKRAVGKLTHFLWSIRRRACKNAYAGRGSYDRG